MPINYLAKTLYPDQNQWMQRRRAKTILATLLVSVVFASIVGAVMFWGNSHR